MPKSKITPSSAPLVSSSTGTNRTPVKINSEGTPKWYVAIMLGLMVLGLLWLVVNYLAGGSIPFMAELGGWNYGIGFGLAIIGLLMTMGWH
ncbi:cell division protein CrgA [Corynebacterium macginleyi]|uniref:Cell division protein CrgA n=1 Tax=Corynebacterium macginleyi TaxID=38290 RepID=A0A3M0FVP7_9CORY|nr:cell division protein CrgA [Corynebacterium macginleyi]MBK4140575.1 cell division protein CrgA [Corynebacterium macginleyi]MBK4143616.1 cell division protein CrgA [Corynebacterium macginleyi]MBK4150682.1 cell division protein CrgA [Corynebacterium macginleyi]MBK4153278.1 cell division protein CrgA [Corynebacterium macginleyi]MBK4156598.1 cell division protein CrgA [Corynebacterium macginleyi]